MERWNNGMMERHKGTEAQRGKGEKRLCAFGPLALCAFCIPLFQYSSIPNSYALVLLVMTGTLSLFFHVVLGTIGEVQGGEMAVVFFRSGIVRLGGFPLV